MKKRVVFQNIRRIFFTAAIAVIFCAKPLAFTAENDSASSNADSQSTSAPNNPSSQEAQPSNLPPQSPMSQVDNNSNGPSPQGDPQSNAAPQPARPQPNAPSGMPPQGGFPQMPKTPDSKPQDMKSGMDKIIFLDLRDINVIDVFKFLAIQGNLNVVTSKNVQGRSTLLLKNVKISDALDILVISNQLAYEVRGDIIYIMTEDEYTLTHGKTYNDKKKVSIRMLKTAKPSYVLAALQSVQSGIGKVIIDEDAGTVVMIDTPEKLIQMNAILDKVEKNLETTVIKLQFAKVEDVVAQLKPQIDGKGVGTIYGDVRSSQILISAYPDRMEQAVKLVKALDKQTRGVLVETRILQLTLNPKYDFGINWERAFSQEWFKGMNWKGSFPIDSTVTNYGQYKIGLMPENNFEVTIKAMKEIQDTKVLATPRVMILDREEAKINIGDRLPYVVTTSTGTGNNVSVSEDIRFIDVGIILVVTPVISDNGFVTMKIRPEISSKTDELVTPTQNKIPVVNTTYVESTVIVQDGISVILGGLIRDDQTQNNEGVPYLMNIPVLGNMFKNRHESSKKTEIVIIITPHVVDGDKNFLIEPLPIKKGETEGVIPATISGEEPQAVGVESFRGGMATNRSAVIPPSEIMGAASLPKVNVIKRMQQ